jgi:hypothetical protein
MGWVSVMQRTGRAFQDRTELPITESGTVHVRLGQHDTDCPSKDRQSMPRTFGGHRAIVLTLQMKESRPSDGPAAQLRIAGRNLRLVGAFSTGSLSTMSPRPKTIWAL